MDKQLYVDFLEARLKRDQIKSQLDAAEIALDIQKSTLIEAMDAEDLTSFKAEGITISRTNKVFYSPKNRDALYEKLKESNPELFSINAQTLTSHFKDLVERNDGQLPEEFESLVEACNKPNLSVRGL